MMYQNYIPKGNSGDGSIAVCGDVRTHARQGVRRQRHTQWYGSGSALASTRYEFELDNNTRPQISYTILV